LSGQIEVNVSRPRLTQTPAAPDRDARGGQPRRGERLAIVALTGPALVWFAVFMIVPLLSMFYVALLRWDAVLADREFAGLRNFREMAHDPVFHAAARNTALLIGVVLPVMIPLAFLLGFFLSRKPPGYRVLSVIFFTPALISASARAMIFVGVYQPDGILNGVLDTVGLDALKRVWLANGSTALWTIVGVELWSGIGFTAVIFAAALGAVPAEIYEAARTDGATTWQVIWRVAYPISRPFVGLMTMLQFLWLLLANAQNVLLLTKGGPGSSSMTLGYLLYDQAFVSGHLAYSQAIGVVLFGVGLLGMLLIRYAFREDKS
jgi:multiple sugar transport system permease protein